MPSNFLRNQIWMHFALLKILYDVLKKKIFKNHLNGFKLISNLLSFPKGWHHWPHFLPTFPDESHRRDLVRIIKRKVWQSAKEATPQSFIQTEGSSMPLSLLIIIFIWIFLTLWDTLPSFPRDTFQRGNADGKWAVPVPFWWVFPCHCCRRD